MSHIDDHSQHHAPSIVTDALDVLLTKTERKKFRAQYDQNDDRVVNVCSEAFRRAVQAGAPPKLAVRAALTRAKDALHCVDGTRVPTTGRSRLDQGRCGGLSAYQRHKVGGGPTRDPEAAGKSSKRNYHRGLLRKDRASHAEASKADKCRALRRELFGVVRRATRSRRARKQLEPVILALFHRLQEAEQRIVK